VRAAEVCTCGHVPAEHLGRCGYCTVCDCGALNLLPSPPMAEGHGGKRPGAGRPRTVGGEDTRVLTVRVAVPDDLAELDSLVAEGVAGDVSGAIRHLIRESAKRRARKRKPRG
jgi:hypothetical protein